MAVAGIQIIPRFVSEIANILALLISVFLGLGKEPLMHLRNYLLFAR